MKPLSFRWLARLRRFERRPSMTRLKQLTDHLIETLSRSNYRGENPAIRAVYKPLRVSLALMCVLFILIFVLGSTAPLESAAVAKGTIVVLNNKKTVQHLEGGIIRSILVKEGEVVKEGQPLIELNDVAAKASQNIVQGELYAARVSEARLQALKAGQDTLELPDEIQNAAQENPDLAKVVSTQRDLLASQHSSRESRLASLRQRIEQYHEEISGLEAQIKSADGQLKLIAEEVTPMQRLVNKGYAAKPQLLALQRQREELEGNRGQYQAAIAKARQSITETDLQITTTKDEIETQNTQEMRDIQAKLHDMEEKWNATKDVAARTVIAAPHEGVVTGMKYHTVGGVITPGTPIMDIIPQNERLVVEAQLQPSDIDSVETGMETNLSFSAYKSRGLPRLKGTVSNVSADVFSSQQGIQTVSYYTMQVEVDKEELARLSNSIKLYPGMPVEVFVRTGARSFLGYIFAPITASLHRAFKEE